MNHPTQSPLSPKKEVLAGTKTMDFPKTIKEVIAGEKIHRLEWGDKGFYGFLNKNILSLHKPDGKNYQWVVNGSDLLGEDWIVI